MKKQMIVLVTITFSYVFGFVDKETWDV